MTMFFGLPSMQYFYRDPKSLEERKKYSLFKSNILQEVVKTLDLGAYGSMPSSYWSASAAGTVNHMPSLVNKNFGTVASGSYSAKEILQFMDIVNENTELYSSLMKRDGSQAFAEKALLTQDKDVAAFVQLADDPEKRRILEEALNRLGEGTVTAADVLLGDMIKSFRSYHMVTSEHDIIHNDIKADHRGTFNSVSVDWSSSPSGGDSGVAGRPDGGTETIAIDDHIRKDHLRHTYIAEPNCEGRYLAVRYGIGHLMRSLKDTYKGTLTIIGNPKMKPHDIVHLLDSYTDMAGPFEIEQVVHTMSASTGFITEITPDLCVNARRGAMLSVADAMGQVSVAAHQSIVELMGGKQSATPVADAHIANAIRTGTAVAAAGKAAAVAGTAAKAAAVAKGAGVIAAAAAGWFPAIVIGSSLLILAAGGYKFAKYATTREPIIITPLTRAGKPFVSGFDGFESDGLFTSIGGQWAHFGESFKDGVNVMGMYYDAISSQYWGA